jgi:cytochrome c oxidase cbb3-type subunit 3
VSDTHDKDVDTVTGTATTGHEWDGIKELNTPLPRWWLWTFYGCIVFALGYTVAFPAWPMISSATTGILGYSSRAEFDQQIAAATAAQGDKVAQIAAMPVGDILESDELKRFASAAGESLFKVNCTQCHGTGAAGAPGYPNLNDDEWIWGGTIEQIYGTIFHGARSDLDANTQFNLMPNFGADGMLTPEEIDLVSREVAAFSGIEGGQSSERGAKLFADNCTSLRAKASRPAAARRSSTRSGFMTGRSPASRPRSTCRATASCRHGATASATPPSSSSQSMFTGSVAASNCTD